MNRHTDQSLRVPSHAARHSWPRSTLLAALMLNPPAWTQSPRTEATPHAAERNAVAVREISGVRAVKPTTVAISVPAQTALNAQCPSDNRRATPFGPQATAADSARLYSSVISADGQEFYFFRRVGSLPEDYRIFRSLRTASGWGPAERVELGGEYSDLYPSLSPDGSRMVFSSYRPAPGDTSRHGNAHLWMSRRNATGWGPPEFVGASRLGYYHSGLRQDASGTLHFRLTTPDWREARDVQVQWRDNSFESEISDVPELLAVDYWRRQSGDSVYVWGGLSGPDGLSLVQVSRVTQPDNRREPARYFATFRQSGQWTPLAPLGGGLTSGSPNFAWFSADGCYLHYTRDYSEFMRVSVRAVLTPPF